MIGGLTGRPVSNSTGPGMPMPMPRMSAGDFALSCSNSPKRADTHVSTCVGSTSDVHVAGALGQRGARQVADRDACVGRAEVRDEHDSGLVVEREHGRRPPTGGRAAARLEHETARQESLHPLSHRRAREAGVPRQVRAGHGSLVADEAEEVAGAAHAGSKSRV